MISKTYSLVALLALATITVTVAHASNQMQISLTSVGNSEIDLAWDEKDRMVRTWTEFSNFNPNDGSFGMQIVQIETGKIVSESSISVMTNSLNSSIDFNSFMMYMVNAEDLCQNEKFDAKSMAWQECDPLTGEYEMQISINDGSVRETVSFTIIDTRT